MSDTILRQDAIAIIEAASKHGAWASSHVAVGHVIEAINEMPSQPDTQVTALVEACRALLTDRDKRCSDREQFKSSASYGDYWSPDASMVSSETVAGLRNALNAWEQSNG